MRRRRPRERDMPVGEVCDESLNDRANQDRRERQCSENMAGTAFREAAKTEQSQKGELFHNLMRITISNRVTLYGEQRLLYSVNIFDLAKGHAKQRNRLCQV